MDHHLDRLGGIAPWLLARAVALVAAAALALAGATGPHGVAAPANAPQARSAPTAAGAAVALDVEGGGLRPPTAEESRRLRETMRRMFPAATPARAPVRHADGSVSVVLDTSYATFDAAVRTTPARGADGGTR